jgi:beta-glucosidase/6-phospho-beta-glucosidase/beta-galactosidase
LYDNFEWVKGFGPRFGLFQIDYKTLARTERKSAAGFRRICEIHGDNAPTAALLDRAKLDPL